MCKMNNVTVGIKKLDFSSFRGKMAAFLTDGRQIIVPLSFFPEIKNCLFLKKVDSIFTLKINNSISVRNPLTLLPA